MSHISIIVPVYNAEATIDNCIGSVLQQAYKDFELILIDDGSSDNSLNICTKYAKIDKRVRIVQKDNEGPSSARNLGLNVATGEWISFLDSDDTLAPDFLSTFYTCLKNHIESILYVQGFIVKRKNNQRKVFFEECEVGIVDALEYLYKSPMPGALWNKLFKKKIILENSIGFDQNVKFKEDEDFVLSYMQYANKITFCYGCGYIYVLPDWNKKYAKDDFMINQKIYQKAQKLPHIRGGAFCKCMVNALTNSVVNSFYMNRQSRDKLHVLYEMDSNTKMLISNNRTRILLHLPESILYYILAFLLSKS